MHQPMRGSTDFPLISVGPIVLPSDALGHGERWRHDQVITLKNGLQAVKNPGPQHIVERMIYSRN
jgi:hypothetical protein